MRRKGWFKQLKKSEREALKREERQRKAFIRELKAQPCVDCGQEYPSGTWRQAGKHHFSPFVPCGSGRVSQVRCGLCQLLRTRRRSIGKALERTERRNWLDGLAAAVEREREALKTVVAKEPS